MVFRAADFEYGFTAVEEIIYRHARFDDVARIVVYFEADCSHEWKVLAKKAWVSIKRMEKLKKHKKLKYQSLLQTSYDGSRKWFFEMLSLPPEDRPILIDWANIYNAMVRDEVVASGGTVGYDEYGAKGFINKKGTKHMGDSYGMFPFYGDYRSLKFELGDAEDDVPWMTIRYGLEYIWSSMKWDFDDFL
jgi:hypothetical protein